jgi:hypothetical protein
MVGEMTRACGRGWAIVAGLCLAACGGNGEGAPARPAPTTASTSAGGSSEPGPQAAAASDAGAGSPGAVDAGTAASANGGIDVSGHASGPPGVLEVSGHSDLPPGPPSTAQPFERVVEAAVAPIRPAIVECMRPLGHGARFYRVTVQPDGTLEPRPPQAYALPTRVAQCVEGVVHGTTVAPAPSRAIPYDIHFDVTG